MKERGTTFQCGDLTLEGICYLPDKAGVFPGVVLCHPHPQYGGSMHNNVMTALVGALTMGDLIAFMFNFRGVGRSQGSFAGGIGEMDDVKAAITWLVSQPEMDSGQIGLAGYSFGASVALPVTCEEAQVAGVALISLAFEETHVEQLKVCTKPKLIISGRRDDLVTPDRVEYMQRVAADPVQFSLIEGADHFWWGHEQAMADRVVKFFQGIFDDIK